MSAPTITPATEADQERIVDTLLLAMAADPTARFMSPDAATYLGVRRSFDLVAMASIRAGGAYPAHLGDGLCAAASLWFPPTRATRDDRDDEELPDPLQTVPADRRETATAVAEAVRGYHPDEPHWYLPVIGTDRPFQGQGLGAALFTHTLKQCDEGGHLAYLETGNPRNLSLYKRHGFKAIGENPASASVPRFTRWFAPGASLAAANRERRLTPPGAADTIQLVRFPLGPPHLVFPPNRHVIRA